MSEMHKKVVVFFLLLSKKYLHTEQQLNSLDLLKLKVSFYRHGTVIKAEVLELLKLWLAERNDWTHTRTHTQTHKHVPLS